MRPFSKLGLFGLIGTSLILGTGCGVTKRHLRQDVANAMAQASVWESNAAKSEKALNEAIATIEQLEEDQAKTISEATADILADLVGERVEHKLALEEAAKNLTLTGEDVQKVISCTGYLPEGSNYSEIMIVTIDGKKRCALP